MKKRTSLAQKENLNLFASHNSTYKIQMMILRTQVN